MDKNYYGDKIVKENLLSNIYKEVFVDNNKKASKHWKEHFKKYESILTKKEIYYPNKF